MKRWLPRTALEGCLVLAVVLLDGCSRPPEPPPGDPPASLKLFDGFEGDAAAPFWRPGDAGEGRYVPGAVATSKEYARSGSSSVRITVREGDVEQFGGDGQKVERAELDPGKWPLVGGEAWYGFSVLVPPGFPVVDNRLVIAQWKQNGVRGSPLVAQRCRAGRHELTVRVPGSPLDLPMRYPLPEIRHGQWADMVYHIKFSAGGDGLVEVWARGKKVVDHKGATAFAEGEKTVYNKIGLYRDRWKEPMTIFFDNYALGDSFAAVDPYTK